MDLSSSLFTFFSSFDECCSVGDGRSVRNDSNNRGDSKAGSRKGLIIAPCKQEKAQEVLGGFWVFDNGSFGWQIGFANLVSCHCFWVQEKSE